MVCQAVAAQDVQNVRLYMPGGGASAVLAYKKNGAITEP
jgi:hypothetical protein